MKKTIKMIGMACLVGAFAFVGSSCKKNNTDTASIKLSLPTMVETSIDGERVYVDYSDGMATKWNRDDQVMYYNLNSDYTKSVRQVYTLYDGANTSTAYFSGLPLGDEQDLGYYAFYPASKVLNEQNEVFPKGIGPRNSQTFTVPAEQNYNEGTMDPTSCVLAISGFAPEDYFTFYHVFGFMRLKLKGTEKVEWISITDKTFNLTGDITVDLPGVNPDDLDDLVQMAYNPRYTWEQYYAALNPYLQSIHYQSNPTGKTMKLICPDVQLKADQYTDFYITLRPGSLGTGFVVTVKYKDIDEPQVFGRCDPDDPAWGFDPDEHGYWTASHYPMFPRNFTVLPGYVLGIRLN